MNKIFALTLSFFKRTPTRILFVASAFFLLLQPKIIDITRDKRYSFPKCYKKFISEISDIVKINIYISGKLPHDLQFFKEKINETISFFCNFTNKINYTFIDLDQLEDSEKYELIKFFKNKGESPTTLQVKTGKRTIERNIYPVAVINFQDKKEIIPLLEASKFSTLREIVGESLEDIEYKIVSAIEKLSSPKKKILILQSHYSPNNLYLKDLISVINERYIAEDLFLNETNFISPDEAAAIFIIGPQKKFSDEELYVLDQYLMRGGRLIFFLDGLKINLDKIYSNKNFAFPTETGLEIFLEKYGFQLHPKIIQDIQCSKYPFIVGNIGNQPNISLVSWTFFPIFTHFGEHKIMNNIDSLYCQFASSIGAEESTEKKATGLIFTSSNSLSTEAPIYVNLDAMAFDPNPESYYESYIPIAGILEGEFESAFKNELLLPNNANKENFISKSLSTKIFLAGSSSLALNQESRSSKEILPLGFDLFSKKQHSNKPFIRNLINFICDNSKIVYKKKLKTIYYLDTATCQKYKILIQFIVFAVPIFLVLVLAFIFNKNYLKKYSKS